MKPSLASDSAGMVRGLLRSSRQGALATLMVDSGAPYCSLVNVAPDADGAPLLLVSALALHTKNIVSDARVSLMLDERRAGDPLEGARIMLAGRPGQPPPTTCRGSGGGTSHFTPSAAEFAGFADFSFLRIFPTGVHLVAGFGRIVDLPPARFLTVTDDAEGLLAAEEGIVAHLNTDHRDTMNLYAVHLAGAPAGDWHCVACDPDGLDLAAEGRYLRLAFPRRVTSPEVLRMLLKDLAAQARAKAG